MAERGAAIEVEVWEMPGSEFCSFVNDIPAPLGVGRTLLADGSSMAGFIREDLGLNGAQDITDVWWLAGVQGAVTAASDETLKKLTPR